MTMALGLLTKQATGTPRTVRARAEADDLYEMSNLFPEDTGLPVTVWVNSRGRARHAALIKLCRIPGNRTVRSNCAVVGIEAESGPIEGRLPDRYLAPVMPWIALNREPLLAYWDGEIGTGALIHRLQRAPS
jgi:hypothetical protein